MPRNYKLARMLDDRGYSLYSFREKFNIPKASMDRYVNGSFPRVDRALRIAKALDSTVEEIWGDLERGTDESERTE